MRPTLRGGQKHSYPFSTKPAMVMSQGDRGFEMYLRGQKQWLSGDFDGSVRTLRDSLDLVGTKSERGMVLLELGSVYQAASGVDKYLTGVRESGAASEASGSEMQVNLQYLDQSIAYFSQASETLLGSDKAKAKYQLALSTRCKSIYFEEVGRASENKALLIGALEQLRLGAPKLSKYDKLDYCFFMHLMAAISRELYEITREQSYYNSAKEYCSAAVRAVTENHFESSLRFVLDFCLSF